MGLVTIDFAGKVALVTGGGANGGLGHAIAMGFAQCGANVVVLDIDAAGAEATAQEARALNRKSIAMPCDMGNETDVVGAFARLDKEFAPVDILVNNARVTGREHPESMSLDTWNRVIGVGLTGYFLAAREAGRRMIARGNGGCIVNISSIAGSLALGRGNFAYSIAKAGVNQMTRELAIEWATHGIRVNAIQPAQVLTPGLQRILADPRQDRERMLSRFLAGIPLHRLGEPEDIVSAVLFLASDLAGWITGITLPVDGGNLALNAGGSCTWPAD